MFTENYLRLLEINLKMSNFLCCTPFSFDVIKKRVTRVSSVRKIRFFKFQCLIALLYCITLLTNLCFGPLTILQKFQGFPLFALYTGEVVLWWNFDLDPTYMQIINPFLSLEQTKLRGAGPSHCATRTKRMEQFIRLLAISMVLVPTLQLVLLQNRPCTPPYIMSMFSECDGNNITFKPFHLAVAVIETWMALYITVGATQSSNFAFFAPIECLLTYLEILKGKILKSHTPQEICDSIQLYRAIFTLEKTMNKILQYRMVPAMIIFPPAIQIMTQYVSIKLHSEIPMPGFLVYPILWMDCVICSVLIFSISAGVNTESERPAINEDKTGPNSWK
ncbi:hypothetical protein Fcan01_25595 [Folsomia candida]|uniref:Uncharacterized protein n=1 Tax=Folsomia candida TaxID=158441 RepID=A0A226D3H1_FOLCA|nr:hypothetical protein Fcan01_25595 [Folsomia candida]